MVWKAYGMDVAMTGDEILREIVGARLGAVTFVQDYVQLRFDGPTINVYTPLRITIGESRVRSGETGFRDALCDRIGATVRAVTLGSGELRIVLSDAAMIEASTAPELCTGPEAIECVGFRGGSLVVRPHE